MFKNIRKSIRNMMAVRFTHYRDVQPNLLRKFKKQKMKELGISGKKFHRIRRAEKRELASFNEIANQGSAWD